MDLVSAATYIENHVDDLFPNDKYTHEEIENALTSASIEAERYLNGLEFKSAKKTQLISVVGGLFGFDRLYLGDQKNFLFKLLTSGGFYVWWILDIFKVPKICRAKNCERLIETVKTHQMPDTGYNFTNNHNQSNYGFNDYSNEYNDETTSPTAEVCDDIDWGAVLDDAANNLGGSDDGTIL